MEKRLMYNRISIILVGLMLLQLLVQPLASPIHAAVPIPGLIFEKTASKSVVNVGEAFTYTIAYSVVDSSRNSQEITIVDTIPSQFEIISGDYTSRSGQKLTFGPETLTSGTAGQFNIEVKAKPTGVYSAVQTTNTATVTVIDTNETTTASANVSINPDPDSNPNNGAIGNYVWIDTNENGIQDTGESGINGVTVKLYDSVKQPIAQTTTTDNAGQSGYYTFEDLSPGDYYVQLIVPAGYKFTKSINNHFNASGFDSDWTDNDGMTEVITIESNRKYQTLDFGLVSLSGAIGNFVWIDTNENGIQDTGESGINGVTVKLYDSVKQPIALTTTADNAGQSGYYTFADLPPGTYYVQFITPTDYKFTKFEATTSDKDSNKVDSTGMTDAITIVSGQNQDTTDVGMVAKRIPPSPSVPSGNSGGLTQEAQFSDISGHWAEAAIKKALNDGIAKGYNDGTFRPDAKVTRAEFMVMLMNSKVLGTETIRGFRYKTFRPSASMSRRELEVLIARAAGIDRDAAATMIELGIVNGSNGNLFASDDTITRAEAVTLVMNLLLTKQ